MQEFFKLKEHKTTVSTEVYAGLTTFMTMAYILIVNPNILEAAGMNRGAVFTATALSSAFATLTMALLANYPFALAPGMGLNAFFTFSVALIYGWQIALIAVFIEGVIFILISFLNVREAIFDSIPKNLKYAVSVGIGLFIAFIGLRSANIIISDSATSVTLGGMNNVSVVLALIGVILTVFLLIKKVKGALFFGIIGTYILGILCQVVGLYVPDLEIGVYSLYPTGIISLPTSIADINLFAAFSGADFSLINFLDFIVIVFSFLFVDIFDTIGTLIGVSEKAGFLNKEGKLPKVKEALLSDAIGTTFGALVGTSTVTTYVESAAGVAEGGRTGLTSVVTAILFVVALIFSPIFGAIPSFATAPALIIVGLFMVESIVKIDFKDYTEGLPAFITIIMMPMSYSISNGLVFGILSYVVLKLISGRAKELNPVIATIGVIFLVKLFFI